jgi:hypothetical protein
MIERKEFPLDGYQQFIRIGDVFDYKNEGYLIIGIVEIYYSQGHCIVTALVSKHIKS